MLGPDVEMLDLTEATALARGSRQQQWLNALLDSENGLRPGDGAHGRWAAATYRRIEAFVWSLRRAGYVVIKRPFGPRRVERYALVGQSAGYGVLASAQALSAVGLIDTAGYRHPATNGLTESELELLGELACSATTELKVEQLVEAARRLSR